MIEIVIELNVLAPPSKKTADKSCLILLQPHLRHGNLNGTKRCKYSFKKFYNKLSPFPSVANVTLSIPFSRYSNRASGAYSNARREKMSIVLAETGLTPDYHNRNIAMNE